MLAAGVLNIVMLSSVKQLAGDLHPFQIAFFRCVFGALFLLPWIARSGGLRLVIGTKRAGLHLLRGAFQAGGMLGTFWAASLTKLATISAIGFTAPLFAALLAILLLGERVGRWRWLSLVIGFSGTLIILRPGAEIVGIGAFLALAASFSWATAMVLIKRLTETESALSVSIWAALVIAGFSLIPALFVWQWPDFLTYVWLFAIGSFGSFGQFCFAKALSKADTTLVLPFDFMKLLWASLAGYFIFAEVPSLWTWVGGAIILASSVFLTYREQKKRRDSTQESMRTKALPLNGGAG